MFYGIYKKCRNSAWQCLIDNQINTLPLEVIKIANNANIDVLENKYVNLLAPGESGISIFDGEKWYIIFDEGDSIPRIRFTIMHELGHILMGHELKKGYHAMSTIENSALSKKPSIETEADLFALRTLAPACVLWGLGLKTAEEISYICNIPYPAAIVRAKRMNLLYGREMFFKSSLERKVYKNFDKYINEKGKSQVTKNKF